MRVLRSALFTLISNTPPFYKLLKTKPNTTAFEQYYASAIEIAEDHHQSGKSRVSKNNLQKIHRAFRQYNVSTRNLGEKWWSEFFDLLSYPENYDQKVESLSCHIQNRDCNLFTIREWCHLYAFTTRMSLFKLAYEIRKKGVELALKGLNERSYTRYEFEKRVGALIEAGDFEQAYDSLQTYSERFKGAESVEYVRVMSEFICSVDDTFDALHPESLSGIDLDYKKYLSGKSVAVVGPAVVNLKNADEIDGFDDVLRFNYRQDGQGCDSVFNGEKTTMTHFNNEQTYHVIERFSDRVPIGVNWVLIKKNKPYLDFTESFGSTFFKTRQLRVQNGVLFYGTLHAVPNTICDMLRFGPGKIKIFNADLMITGRRHDTYRHEGYPITERWGKLNEFAQSNAWHDVIAQFNLLKLLWKRGKISGDARFEEIIQLTEEQYVGEVEREYGYGSNDILNLTYNHLK